MRAFFDIFQLELRALSRSWSLAMLLAASAAWMLAVPRLVVGDGTAEGMREVCLRYGLGGVMALVTISMLAAATGSLARERAAKRLQLTMVRPVRYFMIAAAKIAALASAGAAVLALACALAPFAAGTAAEGRRCVHVLHPAMPSPAEEAKAMYAEYMKSPDTPEAVKKARRSTVLRILETRAWDRYETVHTNSTARWRFRFDGMEAPRSGEVSARFRFSNVNNARQDVAGELRLGALSAVVSNLTQAVLVFPLADRGGDAGEEGVLPFRNDGTDALMMRPRRDVELLVPADSFVWNLLRSWAEMVAVVTLVVAFGVFLSAALGRPVALFTAIVFLLVSEMSPSVVEQYPDEFGATLSDRIGLMVARTVADATHPVSSLSPLERLSRDECVEPREVVRAVAINVVALPILLAILAAFILPRKQEE